MTTRAGYHTLSGYAVEIVHLTAEQVAAWDATAYVHGSFSDPDHPPTTGWYHREGAPDTDPEDIGAPCGPFATEEEAYQAAVEDSARVAAMVTDR